VELSTITRIAREAAVQHDASHPHSGLVIGVFRDNETSYAVSGSAGQAEGSLSAQTIFPIASISKLFTGLALAVAIDRGEMTLDDPVERHLPSWLTLPRPENREITVRDLAGHTSGLPRDPSAESWASVDVLAQEVSALRLLSSPGSSYQYSNLGISLLGLALGEAGNAGYSRLISDRVLQPLSLSDTALDVIGEQQMRLAVGRDGNRPVEKTRVPNLAAPAGGLYSTASDLVRFLKAHLPNGVPHGLESAVAVATRPQPAPAESPVGGLCWHRTALGDGRTALWHNGGLPGAAGYAGIVPAANVGVVVLTNEDIDVDGLGLRILSRLIAG
jgi:CubicO group peptidase (beta-lactamase class C family)